MFVFFITTDLGCRSPPNGKSALQVVESVAWWATWMRFEVQAFRIRIAQRGMDVFVEGRLLVIADRRQWMLCMPHHPSRGQLAQRGRGGILLMSSLSGLTGGAYIAAYAATKAFDIIFAESLWAELTPAGVHVLGLIAGATDTPSMTASGIDFEAGHAMDPTVVTKEGLARLPHGPVHVAGADNRLGAAILRGEDRRQSVALMSAGSAGLYGLPVPDLPAADAE